MNKSANSVISAGGTFAKKVAETAPEAATFSIDLSHKVVERARQAKKKTGDAVQAIKPQPRRTFRQKLVTASKPIIAFLALLGLIKFDRRMRNGG